MLLRESLDYNPYSSLLGFPNRGTMLIEDEDEEMPDRTLATVVNELQQVRDKITSLDGQLSSQKQKARELADELAGMVSETLPEGYSMQIRAQDGLPIAPRRTRRAGTASEGPTTKELRAWAADAGWSYQGESVSKWPNRIPKDALEALRAAYSQAHS